MSKFLILKGVDYKTKSNFTKIYDLSSYCVSTEKNVVSSNTYFGSSISTLTIKSPHIIDIVEKLHFNSWSRQDIEIFILIKKKTECDIIQFFGIGSFSIDNMEELDLTFGMSSINHLDEEFKNGIISLMRENKISKIIE